jgi:hypothetical protein
MKQVRFAVLIFAGWLVTSSGAQGAAQDRLTVSDKPAGNAFPLVRAGRAAAIYVDPNDAAVVHIAAEAFRQDIKAVTGTLPMLQTHRSRLSGPAVIVGTLGQSARPRRRWTGHRSGPGEMGDIRDRRGGSAAAAS